MKCPFCGGAMTELPKGLFRCNTKRGPLLVDNRKCPYHGMNLTKNNIEIIHVALIDAEME